MHSAYSQAIKMDSYGNIENTTIYPFLCKFLFTCHKYFCRDKGGYIYI